MNNSCRYSFNNNRNHSNNTTIQNVTNVNNSCNNDESQNRSNVNNFDNDLNIAGAGNYVNTNLLDSLCNCIGKKCICEFDTNEGLESKTGILEKVGNNFLVLKALNNNRIMYCNTSDLMFATIIC